MTPIDKIIDVLAGLTLTIVIALSLLRGRKHKKEEIDNNDQIDDNAIEGDDTLEEHNSSSV